MTSECKGCIVYSEKDNRCGIEIIPHISETEQCPCINCIVKIMCKGTCQDFKIYSGLSMIRAKERYRNEVNKKIWKSVKGV